MVLGKKWLFLIVNGAEFRPLEKGRNSPAVRLHAFIDYMYMGLDSRKPVFVFCKQQRGRPA